MAGDDADRLQGVEPVERAEPGGNPRGRRRELWQAHHHQVAGHQHPVRLHEHGEVALRVVGAHGHDAGAHAAEIDHVLSLEADVGLAEFRSLQQLGVERRKAREDLGGGEAGFLDVGFLLLGPQHLRARREAAGAQVVLGVDMRGRQVELGPLADLFDLSHHRLAITRAKAGVDDERRRACRPRWSRWARESTSKSGMT